MQKTGQMLLVYCVMATLLLSSAAMALTEREALQRLGEVVLLPSSSDDRVAAWMTPSPLSSGTVTPGFGNSPTVDIASISGNPHWFALVDLEPCANWEHDALYVFIDDVTGNVTTLPATDIPYIDGIPFGDDLAPPDRPIRVYPMLSNPMPIASSAPAGPDADYGDAPDGQTVYGGVPGAFPTYFNTTNSLFGFNGGHTNITGDEALGTTASPESDAADPTDSDGVPNLVDGDSDERMFVAYNPNTVAPTAYLIFDVTISNATAGDDRFVNLLVDFDRDGKWSGSSAGVEWAVQNQKLNPPAGLSTYVSSGFLWGNGIVLPTHVWIRAALTDAAVDPSVYTPGGWDGSGALGGGEIEDFCFILRECPTVDCNTPTPPPPPGDPTGENPPDSTPPPGPKEGWNSDVGYFALVVQGADRPGHTAAAEAAEAMAGFLNTAGYATSSLAGTSVTASAISTWFNDVKAQVKCQDKILIYFIAHGRKNTPGGLMRLRHGSGGTFTGAELASILDDIPHCEDEECDLAGSCCDVTVFIESCYSGQFAGAVAGNGRRVITSSSSTQPSWYGSDGSGAEFGDQYIKCGSDGSSDSNGDGNVDPNEAFDCAVANQNVPKPTTPSLDDQSCPCICPTPVPDCVLADGLGWFFGHSEWTVDGVPIGQTFIDGIIPEEPLVPVYDEVILPQPPNDWHWVVDFPCGTGQGFINVTIVNFGPGEQLCVPIYCNTLFPQTQLIVDVGNDLYQILDQFGEPIHQGQWSQYPDDLPLSQGFEVTRGKRQNFITPEFLCGDATGDGQVNVGDAVALINYVFKGGSPPEPLEAGDVNCDGAVNVGDTVYLINYVFKGGPPPCVECP